ncbi:hypothetical protein QR680_018138 [Steinernema hermaphroditum]|uniref:G-protein coupled receptors family 1 profile domain-containing protein n=1 Tax=Steinernema hermaphroditum TaxID=289476 RepID=A0AA39HHX9_9BILA|nr:hypothetical protein QR680_018138 [Steinernema hermaphroditum]
MHTAKILLRLRKVLISLKDIPTRFQKSVSFMGTLLGHTVPTAMSSDPTEMTIFSLIGAAVAFVNVPVIVIIFSSQALKKCKELVLIGGLCTVDAFLAMSNSVSAMDRLLTLPGGTDEQVPQMACFFKYYVLFFFYANLLVGIMTLLVSTERFVAVFFPLRYKAHYTRTKGIAMILGCILLCSLLLVGAYIFQISSPNILIPALCYTTFVYPPLVSIFLVSTRVGATGLGILLYVPITIRICQLKVAARKRVIFVHSTNASNTPSPFQSVTQQKRNMSFSVTIGLTCLSDLVLLFVPDLIVNFDLFHLKTYHIIFYRASLLKTVVNLFIYTFRHSELRKEVMMKVFNYHW